MTAVLNPVGAGLGLLFIGSIIAIYRWMFAAAPRRSRMQPIRRPARSIIAHLGNPTTDMQTVELACRLASERKLGVVLAYVLELPYSLDLNAPLPEAQAEAQQIIDVAARKITERGLAVESHVLRHRNAQDATVELARETGAEVIVTGATVQPHRFLIFDPYSFGRDRNAPCQVVVAGTPHAA